MCCTPLIRITTDSQAWESYIKSWRMNRKLRSIDCCTVSIPLKSCSCIINRASPRELRETHAYLPLTSTVIRIQQDQLAAIHRQQSQATEVSPSSAEHTRFPTPPSGLAAPTSTAVTEASSPAQSHATPAHPTPQHFNRPHSLSRRSSALISTPGSRGTSPALRPQSSNLGPLTEDFLLGGTRDETAFYQAETQTLTRENQMLKLRIRELGR